VERLVRSGGAGIAKGRRGRFAPYLLTLPGGLWLLIFFAVPLYLMFSFSLYEGSLSAGYSYSPDWVSTYTGVFEKYEPFLLRSLVYGLIVTFATLALSYPMAYWIAQRAKHKSLFLLLILLPFFTPFLIRTLSWKFVLADRGIFLGTLKDWGVVGESFHLLATPFAVVAGIIYNFLPFMALPLYVALERLDPTLLEASQDLYANKRQAFLRVTLPLSMPGVFAGSLLTFIPAVGDFINADLLGGTNTTMIGNVIQRELLTTNDFPEGSAISFLLMAAILIGVFAYARALGTEDLTGR
jgi:spermidine/putrescine transport system permease protein